MTLVVIQFSSVEVLGQVPHSSHLVLVSAEGERILEICLSQNI